MKEHQFRLLSFGKTFASSELFNPMNYIIMQILALPYLGIKNERYFGRSEKASGYAGPEHVNPQQHVLDVAPLNSMPYIGPPTTPNESTPPKRKTEAVEKVGPAIVFLPSHSTREEWDNITFAMSSGVALTGSAAMGKVGPILGLVDIGESVDSYLFRVSLPGVARDEKDFLFDIQPDGKINIKGVTTTGEKIVCKNSQVFKMQTQHLCPPGHFTITFWLPGPVNTRHFSGNFGTDGILEGIVKKRLIVTIQL
ncbi:alpha-crystallin domain-containing protein 22.3 [Pistacia vera]|uniref:alpha-crystallin domain-containing protein 22.3 n=1 Tax=Pistacia vera TaxID=55513 RepID=UPI00126362BD|nr:alpha-crystallin domain-containing protein 22.3 [Pistacia vera]